jgi:hypothetical protein
LVRVKPIRAWQVTNLLQNSCSGSTLIGSVSIGLPVPFLVGGTGFFFFHL